MNKILIGSYALKHHFPDFKREPKDVDFAVKDNSQFKSSKEIEYLVNPIIFDYCDSGIASPDVLYTLKMSHLLFDVFWLKNEWDASFLRSKGCKLNLELFYKLYEYWQTVHGKNKRSQLEMSAKDFFNNALKFPVEHDKLHEILITHPYFEGQEKPTYTKILKEGQEVDVCMDKFSQLTEKEKFNVVFEECAVMALERYPKDMYYKDMYCRMLKKFIISHAKIVESLWILENYPYLVTNIPFNFKEFLNNKINNL